jgi:hypothetical protein
LVNYEVTGMAVRDLYRRVKNGQIILESKYLTKATTSNEKLLLRGVLSGVPFPTIVLLRESKGYSVILGRELLSVLVSLLNSSVYEGLDDIDKFMLMRHCFYVNVVTDRGSVDTVKEVFERFG